MEETGDWTHDLLIIQQNVLPTQLKVLTTNQVARGLPPMIGGYTMDDWSDCMDMTGQTV